VGSVIKTGEARFYGAREGAALPLFEFDFKDFDFKSLNFQPNGGPFGYLY
jgi:hypothetical protein